MRPLLSIALLLIFLMGATTEWEGFAYASWDADSASECAYIQNGSCECPEDDCPEQGCEDCHSCHQHRYVRLAASKADSRHDINSLKILKFSNSSIYKQPFLEPSRKPPKHS